MVDDRREKFMEAAAEGTGHPFDGLAERMEEASGASSAMEAARIIEGVAECSRSGRKVGRLLGQIEDDLEEQNDGMLMLHTHEFAFHLGKADGCDGRTEWDSISKQFGAFADAAVRGNYRDAERALDRLEDRVL